MYGGNQQKQQTLNTFPFVYSTTTKIHCFIEIMSLVKVKNNADWLASNKTWKEWTGIGDGKLLSYAGIDYQKPTDKEGLVKEIKRWKKLNDMKLENNQKQAKQTRSIEYPDLLKQVENNKKWKVFTNLKPGTYITYKSRQYGKNNGHKLMKAIIAQKKSYNNEQERKRQKKLKEMRIQKIVKGGIEVNIGNEINNIDLVMAFDTQVFQDHNNNNYKLCVDSKGI